MYTISLQVSTCQDVVRITIAKMITNADTNCKYFNIYKSTNIIQDQSRLIQYWCEKNIRESVHAVSV